MKRDYRKIYRTVLEDHFPAEMTVILGAHRLRFRKRTWKITDPATGETVERGLRYGENPDQKAALYEWVEGDLLLGEGQFVHPRNGLVSAVTEEDMLQAGKHPGKINLTDVDRALQILRYLDQRPAAAIMKHNNPSGVAHGETAADAFEHAHMADRIAAFGGALVLNRPVDRTAAAAISEQYLEVVAAPDYERGALDILARRRNLRIIRIPRMDRLYDFADRRYLEFTALMDGGLIVQESALNRIRKPEDLRPAAAVHGNREIHCRRPPDEREIQDILFGWAVEQAVTSNSVLFVKDCKTVGIGTGEQDRVGVAEIAIFKAYTKYKDALCYRRQRIPFKTLTREVQQGERDPARLAEIEEETMKLRAGLPGAVMISDAFFPFRDGVDVAIKEGITAIAHPGGSERDYESIQACNETEPPVAMVFTGQRAFKH